MTTPKVWFRTAFAFATIAAGAACSDSGASLNPGSVQAPSLLPTRLALAGPRYTLLYVFKGYDDGAYPAAPLLVENGALYGTTAEEGSYNAGTVFKFAHAAERVIYEFSGGTDGMDPQGGLIAVSGTFYGTTLEGGSSDCGGDGCGTVFKLAPSGSGYSEKVLHVFTTGSDGTNPAAALVALNGSFYGTTLAGGNFGFGTVFKLTPSGAGYKESVLHAFKGGTDGDQPSNLIVLNGALYGITTGAGATLTAFKVETSGKNYSVLYRFQGAPTSIIAANGKLVGTENADTYGAVFTLGVTGSGYRVLYAFKGGSSDGSDPTSIVTQNGAFYGTTAQGGGCVNIPYACGTIFSLKPSGAGYHETMLHNFYSQGGGGQPNGLAFMTGALYGTTTYGGNGNCRINGCGTIFKLVP